MKIIMSCLAGIATWFGQYEVAILFVALTILGLAVILVVGRDYRQSTAALKRHRAGKEKA